VCEIDWIDGVHSAGPQAGVVHTERAARDFLSAAPLEEPTVHAVVDLHDAAESIYLPEGTPRCRESATPV
jgi:hypothetical protein